MNGIASNLLIGFDYLEAPKAKPARTSLWVFLLLSLIVHGALLAWLVQSWHPQLQPTLDHSRTVVSLRFESPSKKPTQKAQKLPAIKEAPAEKTLDSRLNTTASQSKKKAKLKALDTKSISIYQAIESENRARVESYISEINSHECSELERRQKLRNCDKPSLFIQEPDFNTDFLIQNNKLAGTQLRRKRIEQLELLRNFSGQDEILRSMIGRDADEIKYQLDDQDFNSSMTLKAKKQSIDGAKSFEDQFN